MQLITRNELNCPVSFLYKFGYSLFFLTTKSWINDNRLDLTVTVYNMFITSTYDRILLRCLFKSHINF